MSFLEGFYEGLEKDSKGQAGKSKPACDGALKKTHPNLHDFMTVEAVKGKPRETGSLFVFVDMGLFKACLTDRQVEMTLWQAQDSLAGLLEALEADLASGDRKLWRSKKPTGKKK